MNKIKLVISTISILTSSFAVSDPFFDYAQSKFGSTIILQGIIVAPSCETKENNATKKKRTYF